MSFGPEGCGQKMNGAHMPFILETDFKGYRL